MIYMFLLGLFPLIYLPPPRKMNLFVSPHHQKPLLHYKMPKILAKLNIFFVQKLRQWWQNTTESTIKALQQKFGNFLCWCNINKRPIKTIFRAPEAVIRDITVGTIHTITTLQTRLLRIEHQCATGFREFWLLFRSQTQA